jgi:rhodanese-related sulfurtransferase
MPDDRTGNYTAELKARLDRGDDIYILDVREPHEYQICNIKGHLIPLGDLSRRVRTR